ARFGIGGLYAGRQHNAQGDTQQQAVQIKPSPGNPRYKTVQAKSCQSRRKLRENHGVNLLMISRVMSSDCSLPCANFRTCSTMASATSREDFVAVSTPFSCAYMASSPYCSCCGFMASGMPSVKLNMISPGSSCVEKPRYGRLGCTPHAG